MAKEKIFGYQLLLDLYGCKPGVCDDLTLCYHFLDDLVEFIKMTKQAPPFIFVSPSEYKDKAGLSGWVPLIESSISIHTLSVKNFITLDIYSCRIFDPKKVEKFSKKYFGAKSVESQMVYRGLSYYNK